jgi:hypothetical protein
VFQKPSNTMQLTSDIQTLITWVTNPSQFSELVLVTMSPPIFLNGYILAMWKRHIDLQTKSTSFNR